MALAPCRECGASVSTEAVSCPHCGVPNPTSVPATPPALSAVGNDEAVASPPPIAPPEPEPSLPWPAPPAQPLGLSREIKWGFGIVGALVLVLWLFGLRRTEQTPARHAEPDARSMPERYMDQLDSAAARRDTAEATRVAVLLLKDYPSSAEAESVRSRRPDLVALVRAQRQADSLGALRQEQQADSARMAAKWSYSATPDPMSSQVNRTASIQSEGTISLGFPYEGAQYGTLMIRDHPQWGRDVMLSVNEGQFNCNSYDGCTVRIRFDDAAATTWSAVEPSDNSSNLIFIRPAARFVSRMRAAKKVLIQAEFYNNGVQTFEFEVGGFSQARYQQ